MSRARRLAACLALTGAALGTAHAQCIVEQLFPSDPQAQSYFGSVVAEDDLALVLTPRYDLPGAEDGGKVYVFERHATGWVETQQLTASDAVKYREFGGSATISGGRIAIGAPSFIGPHDLRGAVYVFEQVSGVWTEVQKLTASDGDVHDLFGRSIDMEGEVLVASASEYSTGSSLTLPGSAYVFEREGGQFVERAILETDPLINYHDFGNSVSLSGETILVGAPGHVYSMVSGRAYSYSRKSTGSWTLDQVLQSEIPDPPVGFLFNYYGTDVHVDGDTAIIRQNGKGGFLFTYERTTTGAPWTVVQAIPNEGLFTTTGPYFAPNGDRMFLSKNDSTALEIWERFDGLWYERSRLLPLPPGQAGGTSAWADDEAFRGDTRDDTFAFDAGTLFVYDVTPLEGSPASVSLSSGGAQTLHLNGCSGFAGELYVVLGSAHGVFPGTPSGTWELPLVFDGYFLFTLSTPNSTVLPGSLGVLDGAGEATAAFSLPPGTDPTLAGAILNHAFVVLDSANLATRMASNAVPVSLVP